MSTELDLKTYIKQRWKALPVLTQQVIKEGTYRTVTQLALNKAKVENSEEHLDQLSLEVLLVILNLQSTDDFDRNVKDISAFTEEQAKIISKEVSAQIFSSLKSEGESFDGTVLEHIFFIEKIQAPFQKLPEETQQAIQKLPFRCVSGIAAQHSLNKKQVNSLRRTIAEVIVGIINTHDFLKRAQNDLGLSYEDAAAAVAEVEKEVFTPVRESLLAALTPENVKEKIVSKQEGKYSIQWKEDALKEVYKEDDPVKGEKKLRNFIIALENNKEKGDTLVYINKEIDTYVKEEWGKLPALAKRVFIENTYHEIVQFGLNKSNTDDTESVMGQLRLDVLLVMLGLLSKKDFIEKVEKNTFLENKEAVVDVIDAQIFSSIIKNDTQ